MQIAGVLRSKGATVVTINRDANVRERIGRSCRAEHRCHGGVGIGVGA